MPRFRLLCGSPLFLVLEGIWLDLPGDPHAQSKPGDEGCQGRLLPQLDLQILRTEQQLLVLLGDVPPEGMVGVVQRSFQLRVSWLPTEPLVQSLHVVVHGVSPPLQRHTIPRCWLNSQGDAASIIRKVTTWLPAWKLYLCFSGAIPDVGNSYSNSPGTPQRLFAVLRRQLNFTEKSTIAMISCTEQRPFKTPQLPAPRAVVREPAQQKRRFFLLLYF